MTGYWKTDHNVTLGQLHFIGPATRGPQQAEILDADAEIRGPKSQAIIFPIISVKYGNLYHVNCNVRHRATMVNHTLLIVGSNVGGFAAQ